MDWGRDLKKRIPGARNFKYGELIKSNTALRKGLINRPNEIQWQSLELLAQSILQPVRDHFGPIRITSGFRTPELCIEIGSTAKSSHTFGWAADFEPVDVHIRLFDMLEWVYDNLRYDTLIAEYFPGGWVHCSRPGINSGLRQRLKLKDPDHNFELVSMARLRQLYG